jgi:2-polyprenyl-3-methyl-5-hydroxy-6-metoxy-1,4-benzoquinol methylase
MFNALKIRIAKWLEKSASHPADELDTNFYRAFEDRFRGSRELIKQRVQVYLSFVQPVAQRHPRLPVLDLGCGRGEWLEVLGEAGISAHGVDVDTGMLCGCTELGLTVQQSDALVFLRQQGNASHVCISLMHVVEHVPFDVVKQLVKEARRVLVDDGILIMETPNPENYTVGACNFYMDPTHRNPLPPLLLAFLPEYYGFERVKIVRLQEQEGLIIKNKFDSADYLTCISPDYAVVAQVKNIKNVEDNIDHRKNVWDQEYGINLNFMQKRNAEAKKLDL